MEGYPTANDFVVFDGDGGVWTCTGNIYERPHTTACIRARGQLCVYGCMCMYVCVYVCVYVCMYVCVGMYVCSVCMYVCMYVCVYG